MDALYGLCMLIVGLINLAPVVGVLGEAKLVRAYGVNIDDNNMAILLIHRALLFGGIGLLVLASIVLPELRVAAMALAGTSMLGFVLIAHAKGFFNERLRSVVKIDYFGLAVLVGAIVLHIQASR